MKRLSFLLVFLFIYTFAFSQNRSRVIDSLTHLLSTAKEDTLQVKLLNKLCNRLLEANDFNGSLNYSKKALALSEKINFNSGKATAYTNMGVVYFRQGDYGNGLKNYLEALATAQKINNKPLMADAYNYIGIIYVSQGNNLEALKNYLHALSISEEIADKHGMVNVYGNLGIIYERQNNYEEALRSFSASLKMAQQLGDKKSVAGDYINMGHVYELQANYNQALKNYLLAIDEGKAIDDKQVIAYALGNTGNIYKQQHNYAEALKSLFATSKILKEAGDKLAAIICYFNMGEIYLKLNQPSQAKEYIEKALAVSKEIGSRDKTEVGYLLLSQLDSLQGNFKQAYLHHLLYSAIRDSLLNKESAKQISQLKIQFETEKKDKEILLLNKNNEIKTARIEKQRTTVKYVIAGSLLLLVFSIITVWLYNQRRKAVFKREILETKMKALRSQMNPHFTFNVLNSIQYYAGENDMKAVQHYMRQFAKLIRMVLDQSRTSYITVEQELNMLKLYLELEEMRFEEKFKYSIESSLGNFNPANVLIPGMLIQPIVENAIKHGIEHKEGNAVVQIAFYLQNKMLICKITDNGIGRAEAARIKAGDDTHISVATTIIKERMEALSIIYNIHLACKTEDLFDSEGNASGTCVILEMPVQIKNEELKTKLDFEWS